MYIINMISVYHIIKKSFERKLLKWMKENQKRTSRIMYLMYKEEKKDGTN